MAKIKVKNAGNSTVIVPNGRGGDIILLPGYEGEIEDRYLTVFSGKLVEVKEEKKEEVINEPTEEGVEEVEEPSNTPTEKPKTPNPRRRR